jgi:hypothetical protein
MSPRLPEPVGSQISDEYARKTAWRALVQLLPGIGGSIDLILTARGTEYREARVNDFLRKLDTRLRLLEIPSLPPSEELYDFVVFTLEAVARSRAELKRHQFSALAAKQFFDAGELAGS